MGEPIVRRIAASVLRGWPCVLAMEKRCGSPAAVPIVVSGDRPGSGCNKPRRAAQDGALRYPQEPAAPVRLPRKRRGCEDGGEARDCKCAEQFRGNTEPRSHPDAPPASSEREGVSERRAAREQPRSHVRLQASRHSPGSGVRGMHQGGDVAPFERTRAPMSERIRRIVDEAPPGPPTSRYGVS